MASAVQPTTAPDETARDQFSLLDPARSRSHRAKVGERLWRDPVAVLAGTIIVCLVGMAVFAPWVSPVDPFEAAMIDRLKPVGTPGHLLGTDELGRDMLSRLMLGGRLSLFMGISPVVFAFVIGSSIGVIAGYVGGGLNTVLMRGIDIFYAFPSVLLAIALAGALGAGLANAVISLTVVFVPQIARVAESVTTQARRSGYIEAAVASGASGTSIVVVHLLRNVIGPVFVYATSLVSVSIIISSGLSFLGLGVKPPQPEWGLMLNTLRSAIYSQPLVAVLPGAMIFLTSISFNLLADSLRSAMEVKQ